ncbi:uncharacterized protein LOC133173316 [Saccostrea echinata]|uniref:uncharacterized protein LOC133173316 n=1 Tax=Saccostrea echinata TaxID=191078 RepID=UPI002A828E23|nr:uncharacterized protein LOC133173316 [Saccostrea echinata]
MSESRKYALGNHNGKGISSMNGELIYMLKDLRKSETTNNGIRNSRIAKVNRDREIDKMQKEQMLQVSSIKKSQEAIYKTLVRVNRDKIKTTKDRISNTQEDLRTRTQKLRLKLLVRKVVEKFRENVQEKKLRRYVLLDKSDGNEIKVKISSTVFNKEKINITNEEDYKELSLNVDSLDQEDTDETLLSPVNLDKNKDMVGQLSRPTSRSSFEDAITAEYLDRDNDAYKDDKDDQMLDMNERGVTIKELESLNDKPATPAKRTIIVTLPNLSSDLTPKKKKKDRAGAFVGTSMKYKEMYDCSKCEIKESERGGKNTPNPNRARSARSSSSGGSYKMDENNSRLNRLNDLPSLKVTLDQINAGTYSAIFQNTNNMLNKVEHFLNTSIKPRNEELHKPPQETRKEDSEKTRQRKINIRNHLLETSGKLSGRSIPMVRAEDSEMEKLSVIGLNPKNGDNTEGRVSSQSVNSVQSSTTLSKRMSVQYMNRKRAKAKQERFPKLQENINESKEGPPIVFLDTKMEQSLEQEMKSQRRLIKSEYTARETRDESTKNLKKKERGNHSRQNQPLKESRKPPEATPVTTNTENKEQEIKKPSNMSEFVYRVFLRQNQFSKLPSYMDPNVDALRHCRYLRHYKRMNVAEKMAARYARNSCWQSKPFSVQEEFRTMNRLGLVPSSAN